MRKKRAMRERITFQSPVTVTGSYGHPKVDSWASDPLLENLPAHWEHTGGTESFRGKQIEAGIAGVFEVRTTALPLSPKMRVIHTNDAGKAYEVVSVRPSENGHEGGFRYFWVFVRGLDND